MKRNNFRSLSVGLACSLLSAAIITSCAQDVYDDEADVEGETPDTEVAALAEPLTSAACSGSSTFEAETVAHSEFFCVYASMIAGEYK